MIDGVIVKPLKKHCDERGYLMEMLRSDNAIFDRFAMCYVSCNYPSVIRAWHYHKMQDDHFCVVKGMCKVALYDDREGSATLGEVNEFFLGDDNPAILRIPAGVLHGYKTVGTEPSLLINFPTRLYDYESPDEFRIPHDDPSIPYDWSMRIT